MRRLLPEYAETVDLDEAYAPPARAEPFVRLNMISSLDGAISVDGKSGALGGPPDRQVFATLRSWADVIVVGSGTVKTEKYGPARLDDDAQRRRVDRGQLPQPPIAVVSGRAEFDFVTPFFADAASKPIILTTARAAPSVAARAGGTAEVIGVGDDRVDVADAMARLAERGLRSVLAEGGPGLNHDLASAGVLDELCLTVSPRIVGGDGPRIIAGPTLVPPYEPRFVQVLEEDGFLFMRMTLRAERVAHR